MKYTARRPSPALCGLCAEHVDSVNEALDRIFTDAWRHRITLALDVATKARMSAARVRGSALRFEQHQVLGDAG